MAEKEKGKEKTVILSTRDLVLLFVFFMVVLGIVFTIGLLVGRNFEGAPPQVATNEDTTASAPDQTTPADRATDGAAIQEDSLPPIRTESPAATPPDKSTGSSAKSNWREVSPSVGSSSTPKRETSSTPATTPPPKRAESASTPVHTTSQKNTFYVVQTLASPNLERARQMVHRLKAKGYDAFVNLPPKGSSNPIYRVQAGKFRNRENAQQLVNRLKKDGYKDAFFRRVFE